MKIKLLLSLVLALLVTNVKCQTATEINVRFNGFDKSKHKGFVEVFVPDVVDPFRQQFVIDQNGEFSGNLNIKETREILIKYDDRTIPLILSPGDRITLTLNLPDLLSGRTITNVKLSGNYSETNKLILSIDKHLVDWVQSSTNAFAAPKTMDVLMYKEKRINEMDNQLMLLDNLIEDRRIKETVFITWAKSKIRYAAAVDLSLFPFMVRYSKDLCDKSEYFDYTVLISPNEKQPVWFDSYFNYIETLGTSLQIIANTSNEYSNVRNSQVNKSLQNFPVIYSLFSSLPNGQGKEFLIARLFQSKKESIPAQYWDSLPGKINPNLIQVITRNETIESKTITELIDSFPIMDKEKKALLELYSDSKGKVIYHDFLIKGCPACLMELPKYKELIDKAGKDVRFVFLGVKMTHAELQGIIAKYNLPCQLFVLSKNQFAFFERYFNVRSFPHHQIVDKKGIIIKEEAPGLSQYQIESILKKLEDVKINSSEKN